MISKRIYKKTIVTTIAAVFILMLGTMSFGQTTFGGYLTEVIVRNFYQLTSLTNLNASEKNKVGDKYGLATKSEEPKTENAAATSEQNEDNIIAVAAPVSQNFDTIGATATATLPTDFKVDSDTTNFRKVGTYTAARTATTQTAGGGSTPSAGGIYNFGSGANNAGTDRAIGFLASGSAVKSGNLYAKVDNTSGSAYTGLTISYNIEKYRNGTNAAGFTIQLYYSTDGTTWTSAGSNFTTSFPADANNSSSATQPSSTTPITNQTLGQAIANNGTLYLAWNYSTTTGTTSTNAQALAIDDISITGSSATPTATISVSPTSLGFGNQTINTTSAAQSYTLTGSNLTADVTVTPPAGYAVSTTQNGTYTSSPLTITQTGGSISQMIYVQFTPTSTASFGGNITNTSTGATTQNVAVTGMGVNAASVITVSTNTLTNFGTVTVGQFSASQSYTVSGINLTADITVTAPSTNFQVSLDNTTFTNTVTITQSGGNVPTTTVYVRFAPQTSGTKTGNVTNASTGATTQNVAVSGTGANAVTFDLAITQSAAATIASGGTLTYTLVITETGNAITTPFNATFELPASGYINATVTANGCFTSSSVSGTTVNLTGCTLGANATSTVTVTVTPNIAGTLTSGNAVVDSGNVITETNETNNTAAGVSTTVNAAPTNVVINEVYGGGGNANATYLNDYFELYNNGSTAVGLGGYSLQYAAAAGTTTSPTIFAFANDAVIQPGGYYLVQGASSGTVGAALPTPDAVSAINAAATAGNLLFVAGTTAATPCNNGTGANVIDKVGYGTTATCFEGTGPTAAPSATTSAQRSPNGADTNNNAADFVAVTGTPGAMNTATRPAFTSANSTTFTQNVNGTFTIMTSGNPAVTTITQTGTLPNGVTFTDNGNGTATLAGTPTESGAFNLVFTATNTTGNTMQNFTLTVNGAVNNPPTIIAIGVTRQAGSPVSNSTIANVNDSESGANGVTVTVVGSSTVNGVTVSGITNSNGTVTANVVAVCGASNASFTLQASDGSLTSTATLNVTVTANTAPTLTYNNTSIAFAGSTTINPATGPSDNGGVNSIVVQSAGTYTGTISVNNTTGVVSVSNAAPAGTHTITIRATDTCGSTTDAAFTLTVGAAPTVSLSVSSNSGSEAAATVITVTATLSGGTSATNQTVTLGTSGTATLGSDYTLAGGNLSGTTLTIPANTTSGSTTFTVIDDTTQESIETATLTISNPSSGITLGSPTTQSITITDNDVAPTISSANNTTFTVGTAGSFTVMTTGSPTPTTISSSGTLPTGVMFVNNGNGTATLSGTPAAGTMGTYPLIFTASNGVAPDATQNFTLTVTAQPVTPMVNLSIAPTSGSEAAQTLFTATATATSAVSGDQTVSFALTSGTAGAADFTTIPATITIPNGQTTGTATFSVVDDNVAEGPETATFTISNPSGGITLGSTVSATVSVTDNDDASAPTITYAAVANTNSTANQVFTITVTDNVGVPTTGSFVPRVYYLKNSQTAFTSTACVSTGGSSYNCTIDYANVGGIVSGDSITYFVVAQDTSGNLSSNPFGASGTDVNNITTAPAAPNLYSIGTNSTIPGGTYSNLNLGSATLAGDVTVTNELVINGIVNNGNFTLTVDSFADAIRNSGYVIGNLKKVLPILLRPSDVNNGVGGPSFTYPVGTANGYSPVTANFTSFSNGSSLSVFAKQGTQPNLDPATTLRRYWTLAESGDITANLNFTYNDPLDISGTEANYQVIRVENSSAAFYTPSSVDTTGNSFTAFNVSNFSDWTLGTSLLAPTAADSQVSGRVVNTHNRGLENVTVTLSGGNLVEPISVVTDAIGRYHFSEIPSGNTYILTVTSKRHTFAQPVTAFSLTGDLTNINFVGEGW